MGHRKILDFIQALVAMIGLVIGTASLWSKPDLLDPRGSLRKIAIDSYNSALEQKDNWSFAPSLSSSQRLRQTTSLPTVTLKFSEPVNLTLMSFVVAFFDDESITNREAQLSIKYQIVSSDQVHTGHSRVNARSGLAEMGGYQTFGSIKSIELQLSCPTPFIVTEITPIGGQLQKIKPSQTSGGRLDSEPSPREHPLTDGNIEIVSTTGTLIESFDSWATQQRFLVHARDGIEIELETGSLASQRRLLVVLLTSICALYLASQIFRLFRSVSLEKRLKLASQFQSSWSDDLHDGLASKAAALSILTKQFVHTSAHKLGSQAPEEVAEIAEAAEAVSNEIRKSPQIGSHRTVRISEVCAKLDELTSQLSELIDSNINIRVNGGRLPGLQAHHLLLFASEALGNAMRDSGKGESINLTASFSPSEILLEIRNTPKTSPMKAPSPKALRLRAESMGGQFNISNARGHVIVKLKLRGDFSQNS